MAEKEKKILKSKINITRSFKIDPMEILKAGVYFGHKTTKINPKMAPYIAGTKNGVHIIDVEKSAEKLEQALKFIQEFRASGKNLLFIGTKIQVKNLVKNIAEEYDLPYVNEKWVGGAFTNFKEISKRVEYYNDLEKKKKEGGLEKYTKKERAEIDKEIQRLEKNFGGIKKMSQLPEAIFVLDMKKDNLAVKEAKMKGIIVIGIADTNVDPTLADYPIPANDDAISSVKYILDKVVDVLKKTKKE